MRRLGDLKITGKVVEVTKKNVIIETDSGDKVKFRRKSLPSIKKHGGHKKAFSRWKDAEIIVSLFRQSKNATDMPED